MAFETISPSEKVVIRRYAEGAVTQGFTCGDEVQVGHPVKLKTGSVNSVTPVTAGTEFPFGIVLIPQASDGREYVTVLPYAPGTEILGQADGTIAVGDRVSCTGFDAATGLGKYKVTGTFVCGVATSAASTGGEITVTLLSPSTR